MSFLYFLEGIRNPVLNALFQFFTFFGEELFVIAAICLLYWCVDKILAYKVAFSYFAAGLMVQAMKITFRVPRPWVIDPNFKPVESAVGTATGYSYPSGHTQGSTSLFGTIALASKEKWIRIVCVIMFLMIGLSRMYLGVHTPKDVFTAMVLSLAIAWLVNKELGSYLLNRCNDLKISAAMFIFSVVIILYALFLYGSGILEFRYAQDCCKAAGAGLGFSVGWYIERRFINFDTRASLPAQILKALIGLAVAIMLQNGLKLVIGTTLPAHCIRYFLLVMWVIVLYPMIFKRFIKNSSGG